MIGLYPCLLRAALADGIGIVVYEKTQELYDLSKGNF